MAIIYLVDGRPINRHFLATLLGYSGHTFTEARDGAEALALVKQRVPDVIMLDIAAVQMELDEFMDHLESNPAKKDIPVIVYTATSRNNGARVIARSCGGKWVLPKPGEPNSILSVVAQALLPDKPGGISLPRRRVGKRRHNSDYWKKTSHVTSEQLARYQPEQQYVDDTKTRLEGEALCRPVSNDKESQLQASHEQQVLLERLQESLREKDLMLIHQSREAAMGGMISNIAHQWRQPLNNLGLLIQQLLLIHKAGPITEEDLRNTVSSCMKLISHMSETIDDFRNFSCPNKKKIVFRVNQAITKAISLIAGNLNQLRIKLETIEEGDPLVYGYPNEFTQVLLVILSNAIDSLVEHPPANPLIVIRSFADESTTFVTISDNGGGIAPDIVDKIFDPYFTTKGESRGTGLGLFMSKMIIEESMHGKLAAQNTADGVEFSIEVEAEMSDETS